jgi:hypothetical protein
MHCARSIPPRPRFSVYFSGRNTPTTIHSTGRALGLRHPPSPAPTLKTVLLAAVVLGPVNVNVDVDVDVNDGCECDRE